MTFNHGETQQTIRIPIVNDMEFEKDENFELELFDAGGGAKVGKINRTAVTITNDDEMCIPISINYSRKKAESIMISYSI